MWTSERLGVAFALRQDGLSCSQIADVMGVTRNSVVGKMWRANNPRKKKVSPVRTQQKEPRTYSDDALTEKWADRKVRLSRERAA